MHFYWALYILEMQLYFQFMEVYSFNQLIIEVIIIKMHRWIKTRHVVTFLPTCEDSYQLVQPTFSEMVYPWEKAKQPKKKVQ